MLEYQIFSFSQLSNYAVYDVLRLRSEVFVVEQACIYQDIDDKDIHDDAMHVLAKENGQVVAYARLLPPGLSYPQSSIGRVVIAQDYRNKGYAKELMQFAIIECQKRWPKQGIGIGAQVYLQAFYESLGFVPVSEAYLEDGIEHIDMQYNADLV